MRLRCAIAWSLLLCSLAPCAREATPALLDEPACRDAFNAIVRPPLLRADLTQEKTMQDLIRPLRAKGDLLVSADYGIILRTLSPDFARSTKVMPIRPLRSDRPGIETQINRMIRATLTGEFAPLSEFFTVQGRRDGSHVSITLTPRSAEVRAVLSSVELRLGDYLEEIHINEAAGSKVRLNFSGFRTTPALSADERRCFAEAAAR